MKKTTHRFAAGAATLGLVATGALVAPTAATAKGKNDSKPAASAPAKVGSSAAAKTLKADIQKAFKAHKAAVKAAKDAFKNDPAVKAAKAVWDQAKADYATAVDAANGDATKIAAASKVLAAAKLEYLAKIAPAEAVRDLALENAYAARVTAVDAALATFDQATLTGANLEARTAYRAAVRKAVTDYRTSVKTAAVTRKAALQSALQTYVDATKGDTTVEQELAAGQAFLAAKKAANGAYEAAVKSAKTTMRAAVKKASADYRAVTGTSPHAKLPGYAKTAKVYEWKI